IVSQKSYLRGVAIRDPQIEITIPIPIHGCHCASIIWKIDTKKPADLCKALAFEVQEQRISLAATERFSS
ncbi:MAG: hypothetical protein QNK80_04165, partial [Akkermansiaceae bacterium]